jgi:uncharacterized protein (DUF2252 family)
VNQRASESSDLCLFDIKEAVTAAAPATAMPACRATMPSGSRARHLAPHRFTHCWTRLLERPVFVRELPPQDLKLEIDHVSQEEACGRPATWPA